MKRVVLIPSYEPNDNLVKLVNELKKENVDIIIVNDGSNNTYDKIYKKIDKDIIYLKYDNNMGKGYAIKYGLKYIKDNYKNCNIVTMDSDGQHRVEDAIKLLNMVDNDNTLYLGKRLRDNKIPFKSKIGNVFSRIVFRLSTHKDIYDTQTGLRSFNSNLISILLDVEGNRFDYEMNVLYKLIDNNINIIEEEINTIYEDGNKGTHFRMLKDSFLVYKKLFMFIISSISSFIIDYGLYVLFNILGIKVIISNILARIVSSIYNYLFNRNIVFKDNKDYYKTIFKYYSLAIFILLMNSILLYIFVNVLCFNKYIMKIIIDTILFIVSYFIQNNKIFKKRRIK